MKFQFCEKAFSFRMDEARALCSLSEGLNETSSGTVLRGALLLSVSAFDFLVHEIVRVEITHRIQSGISVDLEIPLTSVRGEPNELARQCDLIIRRNHSYKAFASSKGLKEAFRPLTSDIWGQIGRANTISLQDPKERLDVIWRWRNRIAHEGDFVPSTLAFESWPIFRSDVEDAIDFLSGLGSIVITSSADI